jgi:hypothetical protein
MRYLTIKLGEGVGIGAYYGSFFYHTRPAYHERGTGVACGITRIRASLEHRTMCTAMARRATPIRFNDVEREIITDEARRLGMTFTELVRVTALAFCLYERGVRGTERGETIEELVERLRES